MTAGYDGTIRIDSSIDPKGFNKGTKSLGNSLSGLLRSVKAIGAALGLAFSGAAVLGFVKDAMSSFDLLKSSVGKNIVAITDSFAGLKAAVANVAVSILTVLTPYIITAIQWVTKFLNILTGVIQALFGVSGAMGAVADSTADAGKEVKKAQGPLASFDQLNVLPAKNEASDNAGKPALPITEIPDGLLAKVEEFKNKMLDFLQPVTDALGGLKRALEPLGKTIWEGLQWAWENILQPLGDWYISDFLPHWIDLLATAADTLNEALIALQPAAREFFDNFLKPLGEWTGDLIIQVLDWLNERLKKLGEWIKENPEKFQTIITIVGILAFVLYNLAGIVSFVSGVAFILAGVLEFVGLVFTFLLTPVGLVVLALIGIVAVILYVIAHWEELSTTVYQIMFIIGHYVGNTVLDIMNAFGKGLDWVQEKFVTVFEDVKTFVKGIINSIIDMINGMIASITNGLNFVLGGASLVGGGLGMPAFAAASAPMQIPHLATGAVIPPNAQFAAILGDQRSGTNIETPEALLRQIMREEMQGSGGDLTIPITLTLDGEVVYKNQKRVSKRYGTSLISGGNI